MAPSSTPKRKPPQRRAAKGKSAAAPQRGVRGYFAETRAPLTAAALTLPLLLLYGVGSLFVPEARNGADLLTSALSLSFTTAGWQGWRPWAWFYGVLVLINLSIVIWLGRRARLSWIIVPPLLVECAIYAVLTGTAADWLTSQMLDAARAHLAASRLSAAAGTEAGVDTWTGLLISAGAGLHEELIFRLAGIGLIARVWLGDNWRIYALPVVLLAFLSSLAFAGVHHLVEPFTWGAMIFRTVAGLVFASLYLARGFAVAAWTHALYDVWILVVLGR